MVASTQKIDPMPVITGAAVYPQEIFSRIQQLGVNLLEVEALDLARQAGSLKATNTVLIGVLSVLMPFAKEKWEDAIRQIAPTQFVELNLRAFSLGREAACSK